MADVAGNLSKDNQVSESIGVVIDINDRYGYNFSGSSQWWKI